MHYWELKAIAASPPITTIDKSPQHTLSFSMLQNMAPGSTQLLTEMSTRNLPGGKGRPER
jgi:hypothetical protein